MVGKGILKQGLATVNHGFAWVDNWFTQSQHKDIPPPLFIVGVPRSGTTLTYQIITQQFQVGYFTTMMGYCYGMPNIIHYLTRPWIAKQRLLGFNSSYGKIRGLLSPSENANYWLQWFPADGKLGHYLQPNTIDISNYQSLQTSVASITQIMQMPMVFKCLYLDMTVGTLAQIFPESKFLVLHRQPIMVCQSLFIGRMKQARPENWWSVKIPYYQQLLSQPIWQQIVEQVFHTERLILNDLNQYANGRYLILDYEDICQQPYAMLEKISQWLKPLGYQTYTNNCIPEKFSISNQITLSHDLMSKMQTHLAELKSQEFAL